jgi:hypothetical protein
MELIAWYAIVPLALTSLLSGLIMSVGTKWGLFRHYWVLISLLLTIIATVMKRSTTPAEARSIQSLRLQTA